MEILISANSFTQFMNNGTCDNDCSDCNDCNDCNDCGNDCSCYANYYHGDDCMIGA